MTRSESAGSRRSTLERRRDVCVWIAALAAWRGGLVGRLLGKDRALDDIIGASPHELAASMRPRRAGVKRGRSAPGTVRQEDEERRAEESAFERVLAAGPEGAAASFSGPCDLVTWDDEWYPAALRAVRDAPPALFVRGSAGAEALCELRSRPVVAIVGTRNPSPYGREMAAAIARDLTAAGVLVVSGMALGVDAIGQAEAVRSHGDRRGLSTIGVLGCGPDIVYPRTNQRLFDAVSATGLLVSEFPPGVPAMAWRFPARNRVIAGLARAVVVVEGSERSGSLHTATYAMDLGRDVLAVPGEAGRRLSGAPHKLLRSGAHLCESADDVLEAIGCRQLAWTTAPLAAEAFTGTMARVVAELDGGARTVDQLAQAAASPVVDVAVMMTNLELEGVVEAAGGGSYRLRRDHRRRTPEQPAPS